MEKYTEVRIAPSDDAPGDGTLPFQVAAIAMALLINEEGPVMADILERVFPGTIPPRGAEDCMIRCVFPGELIFPGELRIDAKSGNGNAAKMLAMLMRVFGIRYEAACIRECARSGSITTMEASMPYFCESKDFCIAYAKHEPQDEMKDEWKFIAELVPDGSLLAEGGCQYTKHTGLTDRAVRACKKRYGEKKPSLYPACIMADGSLLGKVSVIPVRETTFEKKAEKQDFSNLIPDTDWDEVERYIRKAKA